MIGNYYIHSSKNYDKIGQPPVDTDGVEVIAEAGSNDDNNNVDEKTKRFHALISRWC